MPRYDQAKPFVKWAGGKGHLISQLELLFPNCLNTLGPVTYVEPFVGGGAMLFYILNKFKSVNKIIINDINPDLIECYRLIKDEPSKLIRALHSLQKQYILATNETQRKELYYSLRQLYNSKSSSVTRQAALFMYLNHTCFNGLYRVNSKSEFNVPCGRYKSPCICNEEVILADHELLQKVDVVLLNGDYKAVGEYLNPQETTFVYFDPPYMPLSVTSYFKQYSSSPFGEKEQKDLLAFCQQIDKQGISFMLSNSDCKTASGESFFEDLYKGFNIDRILARRYINAHTEKRNKLPEIVIRNYINELNTTTE